MKKGKKEVISVRRLNNKKINNIHDKFYNEFKNIYDSQFLIIFEDILNLSKKDFFNTISTKVKILFNAQYIQHNNKAEKITDEKIQSSLNSFNKEYEQKYNNYKEEINQLLNNHKFNKKNINGNKDNYITNFRKHCWKNGKYAMHNCGKKNKKEYFLPIYSNKIGNNNDNKNKIRQRKPYIQNNIDKKDKEIKELKYLFCPECKKIYFIQKFLNYCSQCKTDYYSSIIYNEKENNSDLLPGMWENNHCKIIINGNIKCPLCFGTFYLDIKYNILKCLKCKYYKAPKNVERICNICQLKYSSDILIYNPLEKQFITEIMNNSIINKNFAHPKNVPCCRNININNTEFYHNNSCRGILFTAEYHQKSIIFCVKCKEIFIYSNYMWTCPSCGKNFMNGKIVDDERTKNVIYSRSTLNLKEMKVSKSIYSIHNSTKTNNYELSSLNECKYDKNTLNDSESNIAKQIRKNINLNVYKSMNKGKNNKNSDVNIKIINRKNKRNYNIQIKNYSSIEMHDNKKSKPKDLNKNIQINKIINHRNFYKIKDEQKEIYQNKSDAFLFDKMIKDNRNGVKTPKSILQRYKRNVPLIRPDRIKYNKSYLNKTSINEEKYKNKNKYKNINYSNNYINNYINYSQIIFKRKENSENYKIDSRLNNKNKKKNNILIISQDSIE